MKIVTILSCFIFVLSLFGCRMNISIPENPLDWGRVTGKEWEVYSARGARLVPRGSIFMFEDENVFRGYLPGEEALCGFWEYGARETVIRSNSGGWRIDFEVLEIGDDSLYARIYAAGASEELRMVHTSDPSDAFHELATTEDDNYSATDSTGFVRRTDPFDWQTNPELVCQVRVEPAYPNPANYGETITIPVHVNLPVDKRIQLAVTTSKIGLSATPLLRDTATFRIQFNSNRFGSTGRHRVFFFNGEDIVSYGDIVIR